MGSVVSHEPGVDVACAKPWRKWEGGQNGEGGKGSRRFVAERGREEGRGVKGIWFARRTLARCLAGIALIMQTPSHQWDKILAPRVPREEKELDKNSKFSLTVFAEWLGFETYQLRKRAPEND